MNTPGPWRKERNSSPHSVYPYRVRAVNADGSVQDIGEVWRLENARLIAAAPEMADHVRAFVQNIHTMPHSAGYVIVDDAWLRNVQDGFRALLARIDGGA